MDAQNYSNHRRFVKGYHILLWALLSIGLICSVINVVRHPAYGGGHVSSVLIALLYICSLLTIWYVRAFPIKAQDRAILAQEGLRYYILTQKALDSRLSVAQVAALRFAPDEEFIALVDRTLAENLSPDDIKKSIKQWKADHHRV